jgi:hypothetical protein
VLEWFKPSIEKQEDAMRKKTKTQKASPDSLLKTSKKKDIELTEKELGKVTGGRTSQDQVNMTALSLKPAKW